MTKLPITTTSTDSTSTPTMDTAFTPRALGDAPMDQFRPRMRVAEAKVILDLEPQLRIGRRHRGLLQERFLEAVARSALPGAKFDRVTVHEAFQFLHMKIQENAQKPRTQNEE